MAETAEIRMDRMYRYQRHIYDLTRKYYLLGRDQLLDDLFLRPGELVVEIGCGTGRNLIALARRHPGVRFYGIDASAVMLETARDNIRRAGLEARIEVRQGLAEDLDASAMFGLERRFDGVLISYALSMIRGWPLVLQRAVDQLAPSGVLAVVDFGDQAKLPGWFRRLLRRWLSMFHVRPRAALPQYLHRLASQRGGILAVEPMFGGYAMRATYVARPEGR
jgi:S-adenosylmethionine-diacylgycerolhomoserine-N-methlytransferase